MSENQQQDAFHQEITALKGVGSSDYGQGTEYLIALSNGAVFCTGGWDNAESLAKTIHDGRDISGSFAEGNRPWHLAILNPDQIVAIIDIRSDEG